MSQQVSCEHCGGQGLRAAFVRHKDGTCDYSDIPCAYCRGQGKITLAQAAELLIKEMEGEAMRLDRISRGLSLREAAKRLGMTPVQLSQKERGL